VYAPQSSIIRARKPSSLPSFVTGTSTSRKTRSLPCEFAVCWSVRHSVQLTGRLSLRDSRHSATSWTCVQILFPNPPPMSCETKRSLSIPTRSAGAIMMIAKPGNWLFEWIVHWPVPRLNSTTAPLVSNGVDEKRSKWSRSIRTTLSAALTAPSKSP
jgi:hypothetical protein